MDQPDKNQVQAMLESAAGGDEASWRAVVDFYAPRVFGLLRANCGDPELAEEITQSTFCTVAGKLVDYVEEGRFEGWLFRIAMNRLRDEMRRRRRQAVAVDHEALAGLAGAGRSADDSRGNRSGPAFVASVAARLRRASSTARREPPRMLPAMPATAATPTTAAATVRKLRRLRT